MIQVVAMAVLRMMLIYVAVASVTAVTALAPPSAASSWIRSSGIKPMAAM